AESLPDKGGTASAVAPMTGASWMLALPARGAADASAEFPALACPAVAGSSVYAVVSAFGSEAADDPSARFIASVPAQAVASDNRLRRTANRIGRLIRFSHRAFAFYI